MEDDVWTLVNPRNGRFRCEFILADIADVAALMVDQFRAAGMAIAGVNFGGKAGIADSPRNWKNYLFESFSINLQNNLVHYPAMVNLKSLVDGSPEDKVQLDNFQTDYFEWGVLQRVRNVNGMGVNDVIQAPTETMADEDGSGATVSVHDDSCCADVLAVMAATKPLIIQKLAAMKGHLEGYQIPIPVFGPSSSGAFAPGQSGLSSAPTGENPLATQQSSDRRTALMGPSQAGNGDPWPQGTGGLPSALGDYMKVNDPSRRGGGFL